VAIVSGGRAMRSDVSNGQSVRRPANAFRFNISPNRPELFDLPFFPPSSNRRARSSSAIGTGGSFARCSRRGVLREMNRGVACQRASAISLS